MAEPPFPAFGRPCERALLVPEQFGLQQGFIEGRTVDGDERLAFPGTGLLNGAGDPFLARPRLPGNQDGRLGGRDRIHHLNKFAHTRAASEKAGGVFTDIFPQFPVLSRQPGMIERPFQREVQQIEIQRLFQIVIRTEPQRRHSGFHGLPCGHDQNRNRGVMMQNFPDGRNAVHAGHAHIRKHGVVSPFLDFFHGGIPVVGLIRGISPPPEHRPQHRPVGTVVVHNQYGRWRAHLIPPRLRRQ